MPASVDGDIKLSVGINTSSVKQDADKLAKSIQGVFSHYSRDSKSANANLMSLQHQMRKYADELNKAEAKQKEIGKTAIYSDTYRKMQADIDKYDKSMSNLRMKIQSIQSEQNKLSKQTVPTQEYQKMSDTLNRVKTEMREAQKAGASTEYINAYKTAISSVITEMRKLKEQNRAFEMSPEAMKSYNDLSNQLSKVKTEFMTTQTKAQELRRTMQSTAFQNQNVTSGVNTQSYVDASNKVEQLRNKLAELQARYNQVGKSSTKSGINLSTSFKNAFKGITGVYNKLKQLKGNTSNTFNDMAKSAKKSFMTILKYAFSIRSIFILFKRLKAYTKEAFNAMAQSIPRVRDDLNSLSSSFGQVKNSLGTAFQPILSYAVPALNALAGALVTAMNALANFFATFTGQKVIYKATKANNNLAKSYGGAGGSAKDAAEDIAEYDKLIVINQDNASGGGGSGGSADTVAGLFEEVPAESSNLAQMIKDAWKDADFTDVGNYIGQKLVDAMEGINWDKYKKTGKKIGKSVATFLNGVFETPNLFNDVGKTIAEALNTVVGTVGSFSSNFHWDNLGKGMGDSINSFFRTFDFPQLAQTIHDTIVGVLTTVGTFFRVTDFKEIGKKLGEFINDLDLPDILDTLGQTIHDAIIGALDLAISFFKTTDFQEIGKSIGSFLNKLDVVDLALKLGELALNILKALADAMLGLMNENPLAGAIVSLLVGIKVAGKLGTLSDAILWEIGNFSVTGKAQLASKFSGLFSTTGAIFLGISTAISGWNLGQYIYESAKKDENGDNWIDRLVENVFTAGQGIQNKSDKEVVKESFINKYGTDFAIGGASQSQVNRIATDYAEAYNKAISEGTDSINAYKVALGEVSVAMARYNVEVPKSAKLTDDQRKAVNKILNPLSKLTHDYDDVDFSMSRLNENSQTAWDKIRNQTSAILGLGEKSKTTVKYIGELDKSNEDLGDTVKKTNTKVGTATTGISGQFKNARTNILGSMQQINSDITYNFTNAQQNGTNQTNLLKEAVINNLNATALNSTNPLKSFVNNVATQMNKSYNEGNYQSYLMKEAVISNLNQNAVSSTNPLKSFVNNVATYMNKSYNEGNYQSYLMKESVIGNLNQNAVDSTGPLKSFKDNVISHFVSSNFTATDESSKLAGNSIGNLNWMAQNSSTPLSSFLGVVKTYMERSTQKVRDENSSWDSAGNFLVDGLKNGISSKWEHGDSGLFNTIVNLARNLTSKLKNAFIIGSPSKLWDREIGQMLTAGLQRGVVKGEGKLFDEITNLASGINDTINDDLQTTSLLDLFEIPKSKEQQVIDSISNLGIRMNDTLQDGLSNDIQLPDIVQGKVIPTAMSYNIQTTNTQENIRDIIREELSNLNLSMPKRIAVELPDSRVLAEVVWDEEEKRYKQYGYA